MLWDYKGMRGLHQARKHMTWYIKGFAGAAELRDRICQMQSVEEGTQLLEDTIAALNALSLTPANLINSDESTVDLVGV